MSLNGGQLDARHLNICDLAIKSTTPYLRPIINCWVYVIYGGWQASSLATFSISASQLPVILDIIHCSPTHRFVLDRLLYIIGQSDLSMDVGVVQQLWKEWAIQILVLISFFFQVFLFVFAGMRRWNSSTTLRVPLWLAYLLADSTAAYTLGHLSIATSLPERQLVAFWAPFLLLHLGGQDTITAYALEDNRLWLRHLQTLVVQVAAAAYVLYRYLLLVDINRALVTAAILMFIVGVVKYGERIWALKCADSDGLYTFICSYYEITLSKLELKYESGLGFNSIHRFYREMTSLEDEEVKQEEEKEKIVFEGLGTDEEKLMYGAHSLLGVCISLFLGREVETRWQNCNAFSVLTRFVGDTNIYRVIEMELSLMYDIMYTKARVIHSFYGLFSRLISLLTIAASVRLMFLFINNKNGYNRVDLVITYILLGGAFLLEITSGFAALVSTWTRHQLYIGGWKRRFLYPVIASLRRLVMAGGWRRWSGTVGQLIPQNIYERHSVFNCYSFRSSLYAHRTVSFCWGSIRQLLFNLTSSEGRTVKISDRTEALILKEIRAIAKKHGGVIEDMYALNKNRELPMLDVDLDTRIIIWYIATHIILSSQDNGNCDEREAIKTMSDYMLFLLIKHPEMLIGNARLHLYIETLEWVEIWTRYPTMLCGMEAVDCLLKQRVHLDAETEKIALGKRGAEQAARVLNMERADRRSQLQAVFGIWVEILCYTSKCCSRDSHARRLSSGGEFLTVVWMLTGHLAYYEHSYRKRNGNGGSDAAMQDGDQREGVELVTTV